MNEICGDNRFEIIAKAKAHLLDATNIDTSEDEMKVLDDFLFRCWQMGWLDRYAEQTEPQNILGERFPSYITEDRTTQVLDGWQANPRTSTTAIETEPQTKTCKNCRNEECDPNEYPCICCIKEDSMWQPKDEPQTEDEILREQCRAFIDIVKQTDCSWK